MATKKYSRRQLPPCPDPDSYVLVKTEEGYYWRRKRGTVKKARLNPVLARNTITAQKTGPAASRLLRVLEPYTRGIKKGGINLRIAGLFMKTYHAKGVIDFSMLKGLELNDGYPLDHLVQHEYSVQQNKQSVCVQTKAGFVQAKNKLATGYYFDAVLVYGNPEEEAGLTVVAESSSLYSFTDRNIYDVELLLPLPAVGIPWMLLLKISCLEGNELGLHPKHYGIKVVAVNLEADL